MLAYQANANRYHTMEYRRCGNSGLLLPAISLGLWHNFGDESLLSNARDMLLGAFDLGITHFDLANNYGPSPGSAEETFGKVMKDSLAPYRDEIVVSTKAGYHMWEGPYGEWGSRKHILSSLDQSLRRMKLDYVDIFYHHRPDPDTPLRETADALEYAVRSGKALYVGISNYNPKQTAEMTALLEERNTPCLIHQMQYSMLNQGNKEVIDLLNEKKIGSIAFSPLAQGLLTDRYLHGIPKDSRAASASVFLQEDTVSEELIAKVTALHEIAVARKQTLAQMALAWVLQSTTSVIVGASRYEQIADCTKAVENLTFTAEEITKINAIL